MHYAFFMNWEAQDGESHYMFRSYVQDPNAIMADPGDPEFWISAILNRGSSKDGRHFVDFILHGILILMSLGYRYTAGVLMKYTGLDDRISTVILLVGIPFFIYKIYATKRRKLVGDEEVGSMSGWVR